VNEIRNHAAETESKSFATDLNFPYSNRHAVEISELGAPAGNVSTDADDAPIFDPASIAAKAAVRAAIAEEVVAARGADACYLPGQEVPANHSFTDGAPEVQINGPVSGVLLSIPEEVAVEAVEAEPDVNLEVKLGAVFEKCSKADVVGSELAVPDDFDAALASGSDLTDAPAAAKKLVENTVALYDDTNPDSTIRSGEPFDLAWAIQQCTTLTGRDDKNRASIPIAMETISARMPAASGRELNLEQQLANEPESIGILFGGPVGDDFIYGDTLTNQNASHITASWLTSSRFASVGAADRIHGGKGGSSPSLEEEFGFSLGSAGFGDDALWGGGGNDIVWGRDGADDLDGGVGVGCVYGEAGIASLYGLACNDVLVRRQGKDSLSGDIYADQYLFKDGAGANAHGSASNLGHETIGNYSATNAGIFDADSGFGTSGALDDGTNYFETASVYMSVAADRPTLPKIRVP